MQSVSWCLVRADGTGLKGKGELFQPGPDNKGES